MQSKMPDEADVRNSLRNVIDPEVGLNIVDLGLIYDVQMTDGRLHVDLTMTTQACPMTEMILDHARHELEALMPAGTKIELNLVWDPPWTPDKMGEYARDYFGWN